MVAVVAGLTGNKKYGSVRLTGAIIAPWPAILGVLLLVLDLGNPQRFWEMILRRGHGLSLAPPYLMFNPGSVMSWGVWILTIFVILSLIYLVVVVLTVPFSWGEGIAKAVGLICLPFALLVATYTGVLISATSNPMWATPLLPVLFVTSALVSGVAAVVFVLALLGALKVLDQGDGGVVPAMERFNGRAIVFLLVVLALYVLSGIKAAPMAVMIGARFGILFWIVVVGLGLIVPLVVSYKKGARSATTSLIVSALVLVGGFFLRYVILVSGQLA
jgi:polysulfide reductase chain C